MLGSLYVALAKKLSGSENESDPDNPEGLVPGDRDDSASNISLHSVLTPNGNTSDGGGVPLSLFQSQQSNVTDIGNRRKVARMLRTVADYMGTAGPGQFDDTGFRHGQASNWPEIPGEPDRNRDLGRTKMLYNSDRHLDGGVTPVSPVRLSGEIQDVPSPLSVEVGSSRPRLRRDTLEVPPQAHFPSRPIPERSGYSSPMSIGD